MEALVIVAPFLPLLLTIFTAMVTMYRAWPRGDFLKGSHVPGWLMIALLGIVAVAWAMIWLAPDSQQTSDGRSCKDSRDWDEAFVLLVFGAAVVGGLAWGNASLQRDSGFFRLLTFAGVALCAPYVIAVRAFFATACGWN
ncbi:MAG TPA: hypothetical protein VFJ60_11470 [Gaiella sp.]|nr:hypothetical protein [Gaiella sp.]